MGNFLAVFKRKKEEEMPVIRVPDIKDYLVREYERVGSLKRQNDYLMNELEKAREVQLKYEAALVTLDEYSKRLELAGLELQRERERTARAREDADKQRDLVNSYKIQFNNAAVTKEQIKDEIIAEVKAGIVDMINSFKGNLSKKAVCEIVLGDRGKEDDF